MAPGDCTTVENGELASGGNALGGRPATIPNGATPGTTENGGTTAGLPNDDGEVGPPLAPPPTAVVGDDEDECEGPRSRFLRYGWKPGPPPPPPPSLLFPFPPPIPASDAAELCCCC